MAKTKRRRRASADPGAYETHMLAVEDWDLSYMLSLAIDRQVDEHYWEYVSLHIQARFVVPERFRGGCCQLTILGDRDKDANKPAPGRPAPLAVGRLRLQGGHGQFLGSIPFSAGNLILTALAANRIRFISLHGQKLRHGSAPIRSISFMRSFDPEDI